MSATVTVPTGATTLHLGLRFGAWLAAWAVHRATPTGEWHELAAGRIDPDDEATYAPTVPVATDLLPAGSLLRWSVVLYAPLSAISYRFRVRLDTDEARLKSRTVPGEAESGDIRLHHGTYAIQHQGAS